jgi:hypothetical protein
LRVHPSCPRLAHAQEPYGHQGLLRQVWILQKIRAQLCQNCRPLYTATVYPPEDNRSRKKLNKEELKVTPAMEESFVCLKDALMASPILACPDFKSSEPFILDTDRSLNNNAVGACLSQRQSGQERVICYGAKKLSKLQAN